MIVIMRRMLKDGAPLRNMHDREVMERTRKRLHSEVKRLEQLSSEYGVEESRRLIERLLDTEHSTLPPNSLLHS
jgi:hypothetical protein